MARYRFTRVYGSHLGAWQPGDVAEFDDETAAWLERDCPGCLAAETLPEAEPETRAADEAPHDRQVKRAPRKRANDG